MFLLIHVLNSHLLIVCAQFATFFDKKNFAIFRARKLAQESCAKKVAQFFRFFSAFFLHRIILWSGLKNLFKKK